MIRHVGISWDSEKMILLQVKQDGFFPADLLFLASTNADGVCYIEVCLFIYLLIWFNLVKVFS